MSENFYHEEPLWPGREVTYNLKNDWIFEKEEIFPEIGDLKQKIQIGDFDGFGRCLVIDGITQIGEAIDSIYTEALVNVPLLSSKKNKNCLIIGGGDGAAAREILKQKSVEKVEMIDISKSVIEQTQKLIPSFWNNCQKDPRLKITIADAFGKTKELEKEGKKFDLIFMDLTDFSNEEYTPFSGSTADRLYTKESLLPLRKILNDDGIFVVQAQELSPFSYKEHKRMLNILKSIYTQESVHSYRIFIELFGCWESFIIASPKNNWNPVKLLKKNKKNKAILKNAGINKEDYEQYLTYLKSMFALPIDLIEKLKK